MTRECSEPEGMADTGSHDPKSGMRRQRRPIAIPDVDRLLQQLLELNGAVAIGALPAKAANLIQKNLKTVLDVQLKRTHRESASPTQEALAELCRKDPQMLNAIQSFLTDEQVESLMGEVSDDKHE